MARQVRREVKRIVPDVKSATRAMLGKIADWVEAEAGWPALGVEPQGRRSKEEWAVLEEARKLAAGHVRMGAK
jgi:hypothetical protein